jgi:hypothetical protein
MACNDWSELVERYRAAVKAYYDAVASLTDEPGRAFNEIWHCAEVARSEAGISRAALLHHEHNHCCLTAHPSPSPNQCFSLMKNGSSAIKGNPVDN